MPELIVDLRSDTVTRPPAAMRKAMHDAEVGDDVYREDPTVNRLQERAAEIFGREAGLYVASGTMGNQTAIKVLTRHGQEVICEDRCHIYNFEMGMMTAFSGVVPRTIHAEDGILTWDMIAPNIRTRNDYRARTGLVFGVFSTALFGGVLPFLYLRTNPGTSVRGDWRQGAVLTAFWGYKGVEIELWYRLLAWLVGTGGGAGTIAIKTALDQFVYCPFFAVPLMAVVYQWCATGFSARAVAADFRATGWYGRTVLPTLLANLGVWLPAVAIIYALPTALQLPMQNIVLCFFTLMLAHMNRRRERRASRAPFGAADIAGRADRLDRPG